MGKPKPKRLTTGGHGRASKGGNTSACNVEKDFEEDFHEDVGHQSKFVVIRQFGGKVCCVLTDIFTFSY